jgi:hypothetical protein
MKRLARTTSRLFLAIAIASALVLSTVGVAAASGTQCSTSGASGQFCNSVATTGASSWTVVNQTVYVYNYPSWGSGYVHWGVMVNGSWQEKSVTGPYYLSPGSWRIGPSTATALCYSSSNSVAVYAWWQRLAGGDPSYGYAWLVYLPH